MTEYINPQTITQEDYEELNKNLYEMGYKTTNGVDAQTKELIHALGYTLVKTIDADVLNTERGPIVMMQNATFNNGIYIFRNEDGSYLLEILKPNTIDKSTLITQIVQTMDNQLSQVNVSDLEVYDLTQVYAHLIANQIIKPIAKHIYPDNELKQEHYVNIYMPRFLANVARYYIGDSTLIEETVNSEPHAVRLMIDGGPGLVPNPNEQMKNERGDGNGTA